MTTPYALWFHPVAVLAISEHLRFNDICCFVHASAAAHRCFKAKLTPSKREEQWLINYAEKDEEKRKEKEAKDLAEAEHRFEKHERDEEFCDVEWDPDELPYSSDGFPSPRSSLDGSTDGFPSP